ncbi:carboxypeptidase regulatory-like domain-containing protein [Geojedonia litorea]|uniref:Carboxypeptidase regulatory-like domain-containing protein n=1 Tax=Geojedonia litorea TaxID=1268269 RepID=A0ABV9N4W3_9FLAO
MKKITQFLLFTIAFFAIGLAFGQGTTTSAINGKITDSEGQPLPGANIVVVHLPTNTTYGAASDFDGFYRISNMRPGGPYKITISFVGYKEYTDEGFSLTLGQTTSINKQLVESASALDEVVITATRNNVFDSNRTGAETTVSERDLTTIPSASRSIADFLRATPQAQLSEGNDGFSVSLGGQNNRFNSINVDGAVSNDVFGLAGSGTDGGQTGANPFSIDALEQIQIQLAPFDVKISGFTGGAINAITRSGSNNVEGSVYSYFRNESLAGKTPTALINDGDSREKLNDFTALTYGARVGLPIVKDKLFLFVNYEKQDNETPQPFNLSNYGGDSSASDIEALRQFLISNYGYDPGVYDNNASTLENNLVTAKLDWNINQNHSLSLTHRLQDIKNLEARTSNSRSIEFLNGSEYFANKTNATTLQWNSSYGNKFANSMIVSYKIVRDDRDPSGDPFPTVELQDGDGQIVFGSEPFSTANLLDQDVFTFTNNFEIYKGRHTITLGTHNEYSKIKNLFFAFNYGFYEFNNSGGTTGVNRFLAGQTSSFYQHGYSLVGNGTVGDESAGASEFDVLQVGFYAQDEVNMTDNFKLTAGIRFDIPYWSDGPVNDDFNNRTIPLLEAAGKDLQGARVGRGVSPSVHVSPRIGFNWDVNGDKTTQVRGGLGIFTSRLPLVWPGAIYNNNGVTGGFTLGFGGTPFEADVNNQFEDVTPGSGGTGGQVDLFASNFKLPQRFKVNVAVDQKLPLWGLIVSADVIWNDNITDIYYQNLNLKGPVGFLNGADNRPFYNRGDRIDRAYQGIYLATNTGGGNSWNGALTIRKPYENGFAGQVSYSYGESNAIFDGTSSQNSSQWRNQQTVNGKNSNLPVSRSDFSQGHRISSNMSYEIKWNDNIKSTIGLFYNGSQGQPYSYTYRDGRDLLNDDSRDNALIYVPASAGEITLRDRTGSAAGTADEWAILNDYINNDDYLKTRRGKYAERNGSRGPWSHIVDLKFLQDISFNAIKKTNTLQLSVDIFNFTNFLNKDWGRQTFAFGNTQILQTETAGPNPVFSLRESAIENGPTQYDDSGIQSSRWQMQVGLRYTFN